MSYRVDNPPVTKRRHLAGFFLLLILGLIASFAIWRVLGGVLLCWHHVALRKRDAIFLLLPVLAVLPIVVATFPGTRFCMALDSYTYVIAVAGLATWWECLRRSSPKGRTSQ